jgi:hypothetical protein
MQKLVDEKPRFIFAPLNCSGNKRFAKGDNRWAASATDTPLSQHTK